MKRFFILICLLLVICGCEKKKENDEVHEVTKDSAVEIKKIDEDKDFVYFENYKVLKYGVGATYNLDKAIVNIQGEEVSNLNKKISDFVEKSYNDMELYEDTLSNGPIISYESYVTDDYISIVQKYYLYIDGILGEEDENVYVLSLKKNKVLSNEEMLKDFNYDEESFYKELEKRIDSEDVLFTIMNIKNDGYSLYINKDNNLTIIFYEIDGIETKRKELVLD